MLLAVTTGGVTLVTACGSASHGALLARDGGHTAARMVGGVPVSRKTADALSPVEHARSSGSA